MNTEMKRVITEAEVSAFDRDGVILLPDMFDDDWIQSLSRGLDKNCQFSMF